MCLPKVCLSVLPYTAKRNFVPTAFADIFRIALNIEAAILRCTATTLTTKFLKEHMHTNLANPAFINIKRKQIVVLIATSLLSLSALAADVTPPAGADQDGFTASFGVGVGRSGLTGVTEKAKAFPLFSIDWQSGAYFAGLSKGVGYHWVRSEALNVSTALTVAGGRREKDNDRFKGLGDIKTSGAANVAVEWTPNGMPFALTAGLTKAFGKDLGTAYSFGIGSGFPVSDKLFFNTSLSANYADKKRMQSQYGVTQKQALDSGYAAFTTKAGVESIDFGVGFNYILDKQWTLITNIGANRLQGEAEKSKIFKDKTSATGVLLATYRF